MKSIGEKTKLCNRLGTFVSLIAYLLLKRVSAIRYLKSIISQHWALIQLFGYDGYDEILFFKITCDCFVKLIWYKNNLK